MNCFYQNKNDKVLIDCVYYSFWIKREELNKFKCYNLKEKLNNIKKLESSNNKRKNNNLMHRSSSRLSQLCKIEFEK